MSSYDLFTRPSEILGALSEDVVGQYRNAVLVVAPMWPASGERSPRRPAKSGELDDTVTAGLPGLPEILRHLSNRYAREKHSLRPLGLGETRQRPPEGRDGVRCGLTKFKVTPHSARRGGASTASCFKALKIKGIQRRGRGLAPKSVRRYEKSGKLTRQVALMDKAVVGQGEHLLRGPLKKLVSEAFRSIAKLRQEELR